MMYTLCHDYDHGYVIADVKLLLIAGVKFCKYTDNWKVACVLRTYLFLRCSKTYFAEVPSRAYDWHALYNNAYGRNI